jgi:hypothetical protein
LKRAFLHERHRARAVRAKGGDREILKIVLRQHTAQIAQHRQPAQARIKQRNELLFLHHAAMMPRRWELVKPLRSAHDKIWYDTPASALG